MNLVNNCNIKPQQSSEKPCCPKILIVDDDIFNIKALTLVLKTFNYTRDFSLINQQLTIFKDNSI